MEEEKTTRSMYTSSTDNVYIQSTKYGWIPARLISSTEDYATVRIDPKFDDDDDDHRQLHHHPPKHKPTQFEVDLDDYPSRSLPLQNVNTNGTLLEVGDMVDLPFLHEAAILYNLKHRHERGIPYTRTGEIIVAVNPYQWMTEEYYSEERRDHYADRLIWEMNGRGEDARKALDPHVYETSALAYRGLACDGIDQSILVSGESGAGKTETVKILMSHLASIPCHSSIGVGATKDIVKRVLDSNPLLEAFGNAKTIRNDNSSRFGKFIELQWHCEDMIHAAYAGKLVPSCALAGSKCSTYLLEKSRVVSHTEEERNYHIFYQMLAADDVYKQKIWDGIVNKDTTHFAYVGCTDTHTIEGLSDHDRFQHTHNSLAMLGLEETTIRSLFSALCVVLQLGNLIIEPHPDNEDHSLITSTQELTALADLMGVPLDVITHALTYRTVTTKHDTLDIPLTPIASHDSRDALAKQIYSKAFDWLVSTINSATQAETNYKETLQDDEEFRTIGLLDIFGFESFHINRFEQMMINYANEKLQQKFTLDIFRSVQEEYEMEGIDFTEEIIFQDNELVLDLVEGSLGLISILNEECVRPKGNDISFVSKVNSMNKDSDFLIRDSFFREYEFGILHYAGAVIYDATHFVQKNMDTLPQDLVECAAMSGNTLIQSSFTTTTHHHHHQTKRRSSLVHQSVSTKFRNQLNTLMTNISSTKTRYIRCIKPNSLKKPRLLEHIPTIEQLKCAGVVAAITISRSSFPNRLQHEAAIHRFRFLLKEDPRSRTVVLPAPSMEPAEEEDEEYESSPHRNVSHVLFQYLLADFGERPYTCGRTRVYFRAGALEYLESRRLAALQHNAILLQTQIRRYTCCKYYACLKRSTLRMQCGARMVMTRRWFLMVKDAVVHIQCWYRFTAAKSELEKRMLEHSVVLIQSFWRMAMAMDIKIRTVDAARTIQAIVRGSRQRPIYRKELAQAKEDARLENRLKELQRKLEEAEQKRVEAEERAEGRAQEQQQQRQVTFAPIPENEEEEEEEEIKITAEQQALMDESQAMLEYLRREVFKLRNQNTQMRGDFDLLKENNQRLMEANASAGASFQALNQHAKTLAKNQSKHTTEINHYKEQLSNAHLAQMELREELKMKQATYIAEVHSRLQYQKAMNRIVDMIQERCRDDRLVEDILATVDDVESDYMTAADGVERNPHGPAEHSRDAHEDHRGAPGTPKSLSSRLFSFFGGGVTSPPSPEPPEPEIQTGFAGLQTFSGAFTEA